MMEFVQLIEEKLEALQERIRCLLRELEERHSEREPREPHRRGCHSRGGMMV